MLRVLERFESAVTGALLGTAGMMLALAVGYYLVRRSGPDGSPDAEPKR